MEQKETERKKTEQKQYVYILECADGTLYTGWTTDLEQRLKTHNSGQGAKYTRCRLPVKLVYHETYETKSEALRREHAIKKLSRSEKEKLIGKGTEPQQNQSGIQGC